MKPEFSPYFEYKTRVNLTHKFDKVRNEKGRKRTVRKHVLIMRKAEPEVKGTRAFE